MSQPGYRRVADGTSVTAAEAHEIWAREAYSLLVSVARRYNAVITYKELAEKIQETSGIRTRVQLPNWIGQVLRKVLWEAHRRSDPPLTALVVRAKDEMVGEGYKDVLEAAGEPPAQDDSAREWHAAHSRLRCYRHFGAELPPDGGVPTLRPRSQAIAERRRVHPKKRPRICPRCSMQLPSTGACDTCD